MFDKEAEAPRIMIVSGIPPGSSCVGEIILRDLIRMYPLHKVCVFAVVPEKFQYRPCDDLSVVPTILERSQYEYIHRQQGHIGSAYAFLSTQFRLRSYVRRLIKKSIAFGSENDVQCVWMILDTPTMIAMGSKVARGLRVPLLSLVWDAPTYILENARFDRLSRRWLLKRFGNTMTASRKVAVVSEMMEKDYQDRYGAQTMILRHAITGEVNNGTTMSKKNSTKFVLGFAGGLYATDAWFALLSALDSCGWSVGGKPVEIRALCSDLTIRSSSASKVEYLGWRSTEETTALLNKCDACYLPVPFSSALSDLARYSFPTKLSTYVKAGRPVFLHAPESSSVFKFFDKHLLGVRCSSLSSEDVRTALSNLITDIRQREQAAQLATELAATEFSVEVFRERFARFIGVKSENLNAV